VEPLAIKQLQSAPLDRNHQVIDRQEVVEVVVIEVAILDNLLRQMV
jgi:hypothetical protein